MQMCKSPVILAAAAIISSVKLLFGTATPQCMNVAHFLHSW